MEDPAEAGIEVEIIAPVDNDIITRCTWEGRSAVMHLQKQQQAKFDRIQ